jgi:hypothetical protein
MFARLRGNEDVQGRNGQETIQRRSTGHNVYLCEECKKIDFRKAAQLDLAHLSEAKHGIEIASLSAAPSKRATECEICPLLSAVMTDREADTSEIKLLAFSFLKTYGGLSPTRIQTDVKAIDSVALAVVPGTGPDYLSRHLSTFWKNGHLICFETGRKCPKVFAPQMVPARFNPSFARDLLNYCKTNHATFCDQATKPPGLRLIDCKRLVIANPPQSASYTALSYIWGHSINTTSSESTKNFHGEISLPCTLPKVIEDAIEVTKGIGLRYLWVDKFCIDQNNPDDKHEQIKQMDLIYKAAELTIIAAAGADENHGLPGVGTATRTQQSFANIGDVALISTMAHPHYLIWKSKWSKRGWTFQEAILSQRRLVFTEDQAYFECNAMNCFESVSYSMNITHTRTGYKLFEALRPGTFSGNDYPVSPHFGTARLYEEERLEKNVQRYAQYIYEYTSRQLKYDSDSLNAFTGIIRHFQTSKIPVISLMGLPLLPGIPHSFRNTQPPFIAASLCWRHRDRSGAQYSRTQRRPQFPTWTWAGWAGAVDWPPQFSPSSWRDFYPHILSLRIEANNGSIIDLLDIAVYPSGESCQSPSSVIALHCTMWIIPPENIGFDGRSVKIGSHAIQFYLSQGPKNLEQVWELLNNGCWALLVIGSTRSGMGAVYLMVIELESDSVSRVGLAVWFCDYFGLKYIEKGILCSERVEVNLKEMTVRII